MRRRLAVGAVLFLAASTQWVLPPFIASAQEDETSEEAVPDARLTGLDGEVTVFYHDQEGGGVPAEKDMPLEAGDRLRVGEGSRAEVTIDGESLLSLGAGSDFRVRALESDNWNLSFLAGSLIARIKSIASSGGSVRIWTPTAVASVRGTELGIEIDEEGASHVGVFEEGQVAVSGVVDAEALERGQVVLSPNEETSIFKDRPEPQAARPLGRFLAHRARARAMRPRLEILRRHWRRLATEKRREIRRRTFERRRRLLQTIQHKRRKLKEDVKRSRRERRVRDAGRRRRPGP
ncbi:MAG: FecR domain-containing protein [Elusimicrobia bacterium]|nr:FecR domain-containing protein [Elusimicrobiota bacterium]